MDEHPGIGFADGPAGRRAVVMGTGLDVWEVVATVKQARGSSTEAARYLEATPAQVRSATRYYAAFQGEIDDMLGRQAAASAREEQAADNERAILI